MWPLLIAALAGAVLGAKKNADAKKQASSDQKTQAAIEANSPWTGMHGQAVKGVPSSTTDIASGAIGGAGLGQSIQSGMNADQAQQGQQQLASAQADNAAAQANYYNNANRGQMIGQNQGSAGSMNGMMANNGQGGFIPWTSFGPQQRPKQDNLMVGN